MLKKLKLNSSMKTYKTFYRFDRVPDELWNEVRDIVQETGIKTIPMEKKCKKAKWLSGEALQIAVKRREVKSKEVLCPSGRGHILNSCKDMS